MEGRPGLDFPARGYKLKGQKQGRSPRKEPPVELNEYQHLADQTGTGTTGGSPGSITLPLLGLAVEAGELLSEHKKWLRDGEPHRPSPERVREGLGNMLSCLSSAAAGHGLTLEEAAEFNLSKTRRSASPGGWTSRRMDVSIEEKSVTAVTTIDGARYGDPLTDNRYEDDGYRFHDVFHLSYAAVLGWSPTLRALLRRRRRSDPGVYGAEDGHRAIAIEEGISAMVFSYAERRNFLEGAAGVDYGLLRTIRDMTSRLEVSARTEDEWERAIIAGFDIWRQARGGGRIHAGLERGTIELAG